jgi:DNA polymerase
MKRETNVAWNVGFERNLIRRVWKLSGLKWRDAMIDALYAGLPAGLKDCNRVPYFANESETSKETLLINKFCKPSKNGAKHDRTTDPEDWARFCQYCKDDVHDTRLILQWLLKRFLLPERVFRAWELDQKINERGMPVDRLLTLRAQIEAERLQEVAFQDLKALTGLENPNSVKQLLAWLTARGYPYTGLGKELVKKALNDEPDPEDKLDADDE